MPTPASASAALRRSRLRRSIAGAALVLVVAAVGFAAIPDSSRAATVRTALLLGDSLTAETSPVFVAPSAWKLEILAHPRIAPCDWLTDTHPNFYDEMAKRPSAVIIETAGNFRTKCMTVRGSSSGAGSRAFLSRYKSALATIFADAKRDGATVVLLAPPPLLVPHRDAALSMILTWARVTEHVKTSIAPSAAVSLHGKFTETLRCLSGETAMLGCVKGKIVVRTLDAKWHLHFCPYAKDFTPFFTCAVYSSGETRWARATMRLLRGLR